MRKRSSYRPKRVLLNPVMWAINRCALVRSHEGAVSLKIVNHQALLDVTKGEGTRSQIDTLVAAMNTAEALYLVNSALGLDYKDELRAAQDALLTMAQRGAEKNRFIFTGPELQAMNLGMELHDAQLDACTLRELEEANTLVQRMLKAKQFRRIAA